MWLNMANLSKKKNYGNETLLFLENGAETLIEKHFRAVFLAVLSRFWIQKLAIFSRPEQCYAALEQLFSPTVIYSNDSKYMKIIYVHCGEETNLSDPRSYEYYRTSSWNKNWKKFRRIRDLNSVILVQRSTNWVNKPTGSWSLCWIQINLGCIFGESTNTETSQIFLISSAYLATSSFLSSLFIFFTKIRQSASSSRVCSSMYLREKNRKQLP